MDLPRKPLEPCEFQGIRKGTTCSLMPRDMHTDLPKECQAVAGSTLVHVERETSQDFEVGETRKVVIPVGKDEFISMKRKRVVAANTQPDDLEGLNSQAISNQGSHKVKKARLHMSRHKRPKRIRKKQTVFSIDEDVYANDRFRLLLIQPAFASWQNPRKSEGLIREKIRAVHPSRKLLAVRARLEHVRTQPTGVAVVPMILVPALLACLNFFFAGPLLAGYYTHAAYEYLMYEIFVAREKLEGESLEALAKSTAAKARQSMSSAAKSKTILDTGFSSDDDEAAATLHSTNQARSVHQPPQVRTNGTKFHIIIDIGSGEFGPYQLQKNRGRLPCRGNVRVIARQAEVRQQGHIGPDSV